MIKVRLSGGLGNQMFQYALGRHLAEKHQTKLVLLYQQETGNTRRDYNLWCFVLGDRVITLDRFKLESKLMNNARKFLKTFLDREKIIKESRYSFDPRILKLPDGILLEGYWQSERYFKDIEDRIRYDFAFKYSLRGKNYTLVEMIKRSNAVSIHIRRGDYVHNLKTNNFHGTCDTIYYKKAIKYIEKRVKNAQFYIFSDDISWARSSLKISNKITFVDWNIDDKGFIDMQLMSYCKHQIIANSSFSWWGAWLNLNRDKIVVAPRKWFKNSKINTKDLLPKNWIRL